MGSFGKILKGFKSRNVNTKKVFINKYSAIEFTSDEFKILEFCYQNKHKFIPKNEILNCLFDLNLSWSDYKKLNPQLRRYQKLLNLIINRIRKKIGNHNFQYINGYGYSLSEELAKILKK